MHLPQLDSEDDDASLVGIDIGGTSTQGARFRNGVQVLAATSGSANIQNVSREQASIHLAELFDQLGGEPISRVVAGAGGVDTADDAAALGALIASFAPGADISVVHDSRLILAAAQADHGIAVIAGTGAAAWGRNVDGVEARVGGWGYLLGDEGSAYWLGREAARHALRVHDAGEVPDQLGAALLRACGLGDAVELILHFHDMRDRTYWADKAGLVFDAAAGGHQVSEELVRRAGVELAGLALQLSQRLSISGPVIVGGGLSRHQPVLRADMRRTLEDAGLQNILFLERDPVDGVPWLARAR